MALTIPEPAEVQKQMSELLRDEEIGTLATLGVDGFPHSSMMHLASDGLKMYFSSEIQRRKVQDVKRDNRVSYTVASLPEEGFYGRDKTCSVQIRGRASVVTTQEEVDVAVARSYEQFEWLKETTFYDVFKEITPDMKQLFFRVDPVFALWQDNGVHMGWTQYVTFNEDGTAIEEMVKVDSPEGAALWQKHLDGVDNTAVGAGN